MLEVMLEIFETVIQAIHLLAVNIASMGPIVCVWLHWRANCRDDALAREVGRRLAKASLTMLIAGAILGTLGLGLSWLAGDRKYLEAVAQFPPRRYWLAVAELVFSIVFLAAYSSLWDRMAKRTFLHAILALLATTNLLYHFPPLLVMVSVVGTRPEMAGQLIDPSGFRSLLADPEVLSRRNSSDKIPLGQEK